MPVYRHASGLTPGSTQWLDSPPNPRPGSPSDRTRPRPARPGRRHRLSSRRSRLPFTPQGGAPQDGYGYPQQPPPGYPPPSGYAAPAQEQGQPGYPGQDQPGFPGQEPDVRGPGPQSVAAPGHAGRPPRPAEGQAGEKGFLGSLFDFSFKSFVTPKIIKVLYVLFTIWTALVALILIIVGFRTGGLGRRPVHADHRRADLRAADARRVAGGAGGVHGDLQDLRGDQEDRRAHQASQSQD